MKWTPLTTAGVVVLISLITLDYLLVQLSFSGWLRLPAVAKVFMTPEHSWTGSELPHESVTVTATGGVQPQTEDQFFLFGPYLPVVAGDYTLSLEGSATQAGTVLIGEAVGAQGGAVYDRFMVSGTELPFTRQLTLPNVAELELRFQTPTPGSVTVERVRLARRGIDWPSALKGLVRSTAQLVRHQLFSLEFY